MNPDLNDSYVLTWTVSVSVAMCIQLLTHSTILQGPQHAGVVGRRIVPDGNDQVGLIEILQQDRPLAYADGAGQADGGRLVTHIGTIGKVIGAEFADKQLVQEGGLVTRAPRALCLSVCLFVCMYVCMYI